MAESIITGIHARFSSVLNSWYVCMPSSIFGIITSRMTRSGQISLAFFRASAPSFAVTASNPVPVVSTTVETKIPAFRLKLSLVAFLQTRENNELILDFRLNFNRNAGFSYPAHHPQSKFFCFPLQYCFLSRSFHMNLSENSLTY